MDLDTNILITGDGSHTLFSKKFQSVYHSIHGAVQESRHIFIHAGLDFFCKSYTTSCVRVLEVGFGTGLNAWLAWEYARLRQIKIEYMAIEPFPIPIDQAANLNYASYKSDEQPHKNFMTFHTCNWGEQIELDAFFILHKMKITLNEYTGQGVQVVFFDAFDPGVVPHMWTTNVWDNLFKRMTPGAVLTTYCCKGNVQRGLMQAGFHIEKLKGPPGKREMLRAITPATIQGGL